MSFQDLDRDVLYRAALEDFAVEVHHAAGKEKIIAALEKDGVTWEMFVTAHPEFAGVDDPEEETEKFVPYNDPDDDFEPHIEDETTTVANGPITSDVVLGKPAPVIRTKREEINVAANEPWLVHMDRENPYFEFRGERKLHKFTQANPFAVMSAADANAITSSEEGFSIATPAQAQAFYEK